jgi:hypothetical protein
MSEIKIIWIVYILQVLIAFGLINVWLVRFKKATKYRGGGAQNMKEEFSAYGLPAWFVYVVGFLKMSIALVMLFVLFMPYYMTSIGLSALGVLVILMLGAITMHIKIKDSLTKTLPAIGMLSMAILTIFLVLAI